MTLVMYQGYKILWFPVDFPYQWRYFFICGSILRVIRL